MTDIATSHAALAAKFAALADGVADWDAPTPVKEWRTREIVEHLMTWLPEMVHAYGLDLPKVEVGADPAAAWREHSANVQRLVDDEELMSRTVTTHDGDKQVGEVFENFYLADIFMHSWDLAKASHQDPHLDQRVVEQMADGMATIHETLAVSGQFGEPRLLDSSHSPEDRLIALIGRDPHWVPPVD